MFKNTPAFPNLVFAGQIPSTGNKKPLGTFGEFKPSSTRPYALGILLLGYANHKCSPEYSYIS